MLSLIIHFWVRLGDTSAVIAGTPNVIASTPAVIVDIPGKIVQYS